MDIDTNDTRTSSTPEDQALAPDDPRRTMAGAVALARSVMAAVTPEQWDLPTPCAAMTVGDLLEHLVVVARRIACAGRSVPPPEWPTDAADAADGGWVDAFTAAAHDIQSAWPTEHLDDPRDLPWGRFPGTAVLGVYTNELTVHTWDLARATGQDPHWADAVLTASLEAIHDQLPDADRRPMWDAFQASLPEGVPWEDPFADAVAVAEDAPLIDRLVAWNGRTP